MTALAAWQNFYVIVGSSAGLSVLSFRGAVAFCARRGICFFPSFVWYCTG